MMNDRVETCPMCGSYDVTHIENRNKILTKRYFDHECRQCGHKW
jgi:DNA-directed RNA polymerase subunit RPC12/RpoP